MLGIVHSLSGRRDDAVRTHCRYGELDPDEGNPDLRGQGALDPDRTRTGDTEPDNAATRRQGELIV